MEPIRINGIEIRNRILMPAMDTNYGDADGYVTPRMRAHYVERAKGGAGLIVTEALSVSAPEGRISGAQVHINQEKSISKFLYMTDSVHAFGAKILAQLHHGGFKAAPAFNKGIEAVTASAEAGMGGRTLTIDEIKKIQADFIQAAKNAVKAGFDGIELHAAHGYLINQFYSPLTNLRTDEYGGSPENRFRFLREIIEGIKAVIPRRFILGVRLSIFEHAEGGLSMEETVRFAKWCEECGADILNLSAGFTSAPNQSTLSQWDDHTYRIEGAKRVKDVVNIPVAVQGKMRDPAECAQLIESGTLDFVVIGRQLLCDPYWPQKVLMGKEDEIRTCLNCNEGCIYRLISVGGDVRCVLNPYVGYDDKYNEHTPVPAAEAKKIAVIGGGPAGMQFAITASSRGHDVTLYEKSGKLGGQMHLAGMTPFKAEMRKATEWFIAETQRSKAKILLNTEATVENLKKEGYDHVVIACGSIPNKPPIPGIDRGINSKAFLEAGKENLPSDVSVAIIGGGTVGCEIAHLLEERGCSVTVLEMLPDFCNGMEATHKWLLLEKLKETAVLAAGVKVKEVTKDAVIYEDADGKDLSAPAEIVIYSTGQRPAGTDLVAELAAAGMVPHRLGESITTPGNIRTATRSALELAYAI